MFKIMFKSKTLTISKMKKLTLLLSYLMVVTIVHAQEITVAGESVNYIMGGTLEIYKKDDSSGKKDKINIDQLHLDSKFEKLIGKQYKKEKVYNQMDLSTEMDQNKKSLSEITLPYRERVAIPGLELTLPENKRGHVEFKLTTPQYHIVLENGKEIYIGMTADQFSTIFPKSWSDKTNIIGQDEWYGKFAVVVLFAVMENGKIIATDEVLYLVINPKTMTVELISFNYRD
jgi:hypothetical protein